jgi:hypothetical protein
MKFKNNINVGLGNGWYLRADLKEWVLKNPSKQLTWYYSDLNLLLNDYLMLRLRTPDNSLRSIECILEYFESLIEELNNILMPLRVEVKQKNVR